MLILLCLLLALIGCDGVSTSMIQDQSEAGPLVYTSGWSTTEPLQDPFNEFRSSQLVCGEDEHGAELLGDVWAYSIQTGDCNWLTIEQPSMRTVHEGDLIRLELWHFFLSAPEPASARVGLATAEGILIEMMEPIPQPARLIELEFRAQKSITKNTPIYFHISNHGTNSWHLLNIHVNPNE